MKARRRPSRAKRPTPRRTCSTTHTRSSPSRASPTGRPIGSTPRRWTLRLARSKTKIACWAWSATYTRFPSSETATPMGSASRSTVGLDPPTRSRSQLPAERADRRSSPLDRLCTNSMRGGAGGGGQTRRGGSGGGGAAAQPTTPMVTIRRHTRCKETPTIAAIIPQRFSATKGDCRSRCELEDAEAPSPAARPSRSSS